MTAEDRTVMQSEVISARTAAAQAEQRATEAETRVLGVRGEGVLDTRLLGKPKNLVQIFSRLKRVMIESEVLQEDAIMNSALPARDQRISTQLYCTLVLLLEGSAQRLLEHAGDGEGLLSWRRLVAEFEPAATTWRSPIIGTLEKSSRTCGKS